MVKRSASSAVTHTVAQDARTVRQGKSFRNLNDV